MPDGRGDTALAVKSRGRAKARTRDDRYPLQFRSQNRRGWRFWMNGYSTLGLTIASLAMPDPLGVMTTLLLVVCYFGLCLTLMPIREATLTVGLLGVSLLGVKKFSQSATLLGTLSWFKAYPLRGLLVIALSCSVIVVGFANAMTLKMLVQTPLIFAWFWMFSTVETYFLEHRASK